MRSLLASVKMRIYHLYEPTFAGQFIFLQKSGRAAYFLQKIWSGSSFYYNNEED